MQKIEEIICPRCQQFLNRPAQVDLIISHKGKVLLLKKDPKILLDPTNEYFFGKHLVKTIGSSVYRHGWKTLPGSTVRREHTLEDAINSTAQNLLGTGGKIKGIVGIFGGMNRDPKSAGASFCIHFEPDSYKFSTDTLFMSRAVWVDPKKLTDDIAFDHKDMINKFSSRKIVPLIKPLDQSNIHIRPLGFIPNTLLCPHCGQYNNRPIQTDGILIYDKKLVMIKRQREYLSEIYADKFVQTFVKDTFNTGYMSGWYVLPGGYVRRSDTPEEAVIREFQEETGLKTKIKKIVGIYSDIDRDAKSNGISVCYQLEYVSGKIKPGVETQEVKLVHLDSLPTSIAFDHKEMIEDFLANHKK